MEKDDDIAAEATEASVTENAESMATVAPMAPAAKNAESMATVALKEPVKNDESMATVAPKAPVKDDESMATVAPMAPVTSQRKILSDLEKKLPKPYLARALVAPDVEHPKGTEGHSSNGMSVLQQHVAFFDDDNDGIVYPRDTYNGMRRLGFGRIVSFVMAALIHVSMSYVTLHGRWPKPKLPIYIERIHKAKHGSDSATFDTEGRFSPVNLENIFSKYALTEHNKLTFFEVWHMTEENRMPFDFFGWVMAKSEWLTLYSLARDEQGFLTKEAVRKCFDGSLFEDLAKMKKAGDKKNE